MWDNIGRTAAEYPHLGKLMRDTARIEVIDPHEYLKQIRDDGVGALLVGMHFGNWELSTVPGFRVGLKQHHFFRAPNNPFVDALLGELRAPMCQEGYLRKGAQGARQGWVLLKKNAHIGMLVDQKQDEGIPALFFGRDAMTTTAPAALAQADGRADRGRPRGPPARGKIPNLRGGGRDAEHRRSPGRCHQHDQAD